MLHFYIGSGLVLRTKVIFCTFFTRTLRSKPQNEMKFFGSCVPFCVHVFCLFLGSLGFEVETPTANTGSTLRGLTLLINNQCSFVVHGGCRYVICEWANFRISGELEQIDSIWKTLTRFRDRFWGFWTPIDYRFSGHELFDPTIYNFCNLFWLRRTRARTL